MTHIIKTKPDRLVSRIAVRTIVLTAMATCALVGLWAVGSAIGFVLAILEIASRMGASWNLDRWTPATLEHLDRTPFARRWMVAKATCARAAQVPPKGFRSRLRRGWNRASTASSAAARACPFVLIAFLGHSLAGQIGLLALLVSAYPFLEYARYHEALRQARAGI